MGGNHPGPSSLDRLEISKQHKQKNIENILLNKFKDRLDHIELAIDATPPPTPLDSPPTLLIARRLPCTLERSAAKKTGLKKKTPCVCFMRRVKTRACCDLLEELCPRALAAPRAARRRAARRRAAATHLDPIRAVLHPPRLHVQRSLARPGEGERERGAGVCFHKHNFT